MDATTPKPTTTATRREWLGLAVIALPCLLYSMDLTVLELAIPALSGALRPTSIQLLWIIDVYGFVVAGGLIPMSMLGNRIGRRRLLLIGAAGFGLASVLAAFSTTAAMLIATRALLGLAGATLAPSTLSLIRTMFEEPRQRQIAVGIWISSYSVGAAIGPVLGGALLEHFWWGSVFLMGVPVMLLLLALGPVLLPEYRAPDAPPVDLASAGLSMASVLGVVYAIKDVAAHGLQGPAVAGAAIGLAAGALFVRRQGAMAQPLVDLQLLRRRSFVVPLGIYALATFLVFGVYVFVAQYLQGVLGLSAWDAGLWTAPSAVAFVIGSFATSALAPRVRPARLMAFGLGVGALGFMALIAVQPRFGPGPLVAACFVYSLGLAPVFALSTDLIVGSVSPERSGVAAALAETGSELGGALGIAVLGSIGAAVHRGEMAHLALPGVPLPSLDAARETLGAALALAHTLPPKAGGDLLEAARAAFGSSFRMTSAVAAICAVLLAFMAALMLESHRDPARSDAKRA